MEILLSRTITQVNHHKTALSHYEKGMDIISYSGGWGQYVVLEWVQQWLVLNHDFIRDVDSC